MKFDDDLIIKRINELLIDKNMTAYKVSKNGGMNPSTLNNILSGKFKDIRFSTIIKICNGFNISISKFFNDKLFK